MADADQVNGTDVFGIVGNLPNTWYWNAQALRASAELVLDQALRKKARKGWPSKSLDMYQWGSRTVGLMLLAMCIETALKGLYVALGNKPASDKFVWPWSPSAHDLTAMAKWFQGNQPSLLTLSSTGLEMLDRLSHFIELGRYPAQFSAVKFARANTWTETTEGNEFDVLSTAPKPFAPNEVERLKKFASSCIAAIENLPR